MINRNILKSAIKNITKDEKRTILRGDGRTIDITCDSRRSCTKWRGETSTFHSHDKIIGMTMEDDPVIYKNTTAQCSAFAMT